MDFVIALCIAVAFFAALTITLAVQLQWSQEKCRKAEQETTRYRDAYGELPGSDQFTTGEAEDDRWL